MACAIWAAEILRARTEAERLAYLAAWDAAEAPWSAPRTTAPLPGRPRRRVVDVGRAAQPATPEPLWLRLAGPVVMGVALALFVATIAGWIGR